MTWNSEAKRRRRLRIFLAVYALTIIILGIFFVPATILGDSEVARNIVALATVMFPWLNKIKEFGPIGERGLFIHSLCFLLAAPPIGLVMLTGQPKDGQTLSQRLVELRSFKAALAMIFCIAISINTYFRIHPTHIEFYERYGFIDQIGVLIIAESVATTFWVGIFAGILIFISWIISRSLKGPASL